MYGRDERWSGIVLPFSGSHTTHQFEHAALHREPIGQARLFWRSNLLDTFAANRNSSGNLERAGARTE
jgi:hypothetical protein